MAVVIYQQISLTQQSVARLSNPVRWKLEPDIPSPRAGMGVVTYNDHIYLLGGDSPNGVSNELFDYTPSNGLWTKLGRKPTAVTDISAGVIGGRIYVPGGKLSSGQITSVLEVYDLRTDKWEKRADLPLKLSAYALAVFEGKLFIFGGWDGSKYINSAYEYNPDGNSWRSRSSMPSARGYAGAAVIGERIFIIGGYTESKILDVNEVYQPNLDIPGATPWENRASLPEGRYGMSVASLADMIFVLGGRGTDKSRITLPVEFSPNDNQWITIEAPYAPVGFRAGAVGLNNVLYTLGGINQENLMSTNQAYQVLYSIYVPFGAKNSSP
jgi:N-acetylneuraminic acid mutarotase